MATELATLILNLAAETESFTKGLDKALQQAESFADKAKAVFAAAGEALAALEIGHLFLDSMEEAIGSLNRFYEAAQQTGTSTEFLSGFEYAAKTVGVTTEQAEMGLARLARSVTSSTKTYTELGIATTDANGKTRDMSDLVGDVADKFSHMADGTDKTRIAQELFGRSGAQLIPVLNKGREGLKELNDEAALYGKLVTDQSAIAAHNFELGMERIKDAGEGGFMKLAVDILPALNTIVNTISDSIDKNTGFLNGFISVLGGAFKILATDFEVVMGEFDVLGIAVKHFGADAIIIFGGISQAVQAIAHRDFSALKNIFKDTTQTIAEDWNAEGREITQVTEETAQKIKQIWSNAPNARDPKKTQEELEQANKMAEAQTKSSLDKRLADLEGNLVHTKLLYDQGMLTAQQWADAQIKNVAQVTQAHEEFFARMKALAANDPLKLQQLQAQQYLFEKKQMTDAEKELDATTEKNKVELAKLDEQLKKEQKEQNQETQKELMETAAARNKQLMEFIKAAHAEVDAVNPQMRAQDAYAQALAKGSDALREYNVALRTKQLMDLNSHITQQEAEDIARRTIADEEKTAALQKINAGDRVADISHELTLMRQLREEAAGRGESTLKYDIAIKQAEQDQVKALNDLLLKTNSVSNGFKAFFNDLKQTTPLATQVNNSLHKIGSDGLNSLNQMLLTGQGNWKTFFQSATQELLTFVEQWVMQHVIMSAISKAFHIEGEADDQAANTKKATSNVAMATSDANLAAANALASVPFPANIAASATTLALGLGYAGAASVGILEKGGKVPFDNFPAVLHKDEYVLPAPVAKKIDDSMSNDSGRLNGQSTNPRGGHVYSPTFHVAPGTDVKAFERSTRKQFNNFVRGEARRRGVRI